MKLVIDARALPPTDLKVLQALNMTQSDFYQWAVYQYPEVDPDVSMEDQSWEAVEALVELSTGDIPEAVQLTIQSELLEVFKHVAPALETILTSIPRNLDIDYLDFDGHLLSKAYVLTIETRPGTRDKDGE